MVKSKLQFLLDCRKYKIFPPHLENLQFGNIEFYTRFVSHKFDNYKTITRKRLLNWEIMDLFLHLKFMERNILKSETELLNSLSLLLIKKNFHVNLVKYHCHYNKSFSNEIKRILFISNITRIIIKINSDKSKYI